MCAGIVSKYPVTYCSPFFSISKTYYTSMMIWICTPNLVKPWLLRFSLSSSKLSIFDVAPVDGLMVMRYYTACDEKEVPHGSEVPACAAARVTAISAFRVDLCVEKQGRLMSSNRKVEPIRILHLQHCHLIFPPPRFIQHCSQL